MTAASTARAPDDPSGPALPADPPAAGAGQAASTAGATAPRRRSSVRSLLRLWPFVRPARRRMAAAACVAVVGSCMALVMPLVLKWIVDGPVAARDAGGVWLGGVLLLIVGVVEAGFAWLRRWLTVRPLARVEATMRAGLYERLQRLPVSFHGRWASGQLLSRGTTDLGLLRQFLSFGVTFLVVNSATIVVGCVILLVQRWTLGLLVLGPAVPLMLLCVVFEQRYSRAARTAQDQLGDLTTMTEESVLGIRVIKGFGRHRSQARAFRALTEALFGTEMLKARLLAGIWSAITTLPELAIGATLVLGTVQVADGELSAGTLVAFLSTALALRWPVESIGFLLALTNEAATAADRYFEVMDEPVPPDVLPGRSHGEAVPRSPRTPGAQPPPPDRAVPQPPASAGDLAAGRLLSRGGDGRRGAVVASADGLRFEGVRFRYPDAHQDAPPALDLVDLHVRTGETMALVGATGSGKTTLTALIPRLYETTEGRITLDGADIAALPLSRLRAQVAVAFEDPTLFSASVAENVTMGAAAEGEPDDGALERALRVSQSADFVAALPEGERTQVGEQGLSLSGGQRQRLALARAVVGRPRFLVLDDPLSALDVHTEAAVEAALREVLATTTALVVAHRPSTVLLADRVALLSGGRIAAVGTHHALLRESAEYRHLMSGDENRDGDEGADADEGGDEAVDEGWSAAGEDGGGGQPEEAEGPGEPEHRGRRGGPEKPDELERRGR